MVATKELETLRDRAVAEVRSSLEYESCRFARRVRVQNLDVPDSATSRR
jgi:hypothetical protein